jgi:Ca2+-binding RTX toxin-like protein
MSNIDIARNGVFKDLNAAVLNNTIFRSFINSLQANKLNDTSFIAMIKSLDASVLTSINFIGTLSRLHAIDDDIITNSKFTDAIRVMKSDFLSSTEFGVFVSKLDPKLLESRTAKSIFSGQLRAEYIAALSNSFTYETLQDKDLNSLVNNIEIGAFLDSSFSKFITTTEAFVLTDKDFTDTLQKLNTSVLTNGKFTDDVQTLNAQVRTTNVFSDLVSKLNASDLSKTGSDYVSIVKLNANSAVVASNGATINLNPFSSQLASRPTYENLRNLGLVSGGVSLGSFATERLVGFEEIRNENITSDSQTWVIIHGYDSSSEGENINILEQSVLKNARPNDRILSLDWREAAQRQALVAPTNYAATTWAAPVAEYAVKTLISKYGISPEDAKNKLNLIGHSLGTYVAAEIGRVYRDGIVDSAVRLTVIGNGEGVRTLTALDPATVIFNEISGTTISYDVDGRRAGVQAPQAFRDVSRFSRAFVGSRSVLGNEGAAATADEAILVNIDGSNPLDQHGRVVLAFARIDEQSGRIGNNLGIRAYADTSGTLGLRQWKEMSALPLATSGRSYTAVLQVNENNESKGLWGQNRADPSNVIFMGGNNFERVTISEFDVLLNTRNNGTYYGEGGNDFLLGSIGDDILIGGAGADVLTGGGGRDTFVLSLENTAFDIALNSTIDVITDFNSAEGDKIGLASGITYDDLIFSSTDGVSTNITTRGLFNSDFTKTPFLASVQNVAFSVVADRSNFVSYELNPFGLD